MTETAKNWGLPTLSQGAVNARKNAAVPTFSKAAETAKNWGLPTLSQGAVNARKNAFPFAAAWTERAVPNFSPHPLSPLREEAA
jgi:hypothetical protein